MPHPGLTTHISRLTPNSVSRFFSLLLIPMHPPNNIMRNHHDHLYTNNLP